MIVAAHANLPQMGEVQRAAGASSHLRAGESGHLTREEGDVGNAEGLFLFTEASPDGRAIRAGEGAGRFLAAASGARWRTCFTHRKK